MDFPTHFHFKNVYFYTHYSYNLIVTALFIFHNFLVDTSRKGFVNHMSKVYAYVWTVNMLSSSSFKIMFWLKQHWFAWLYVQ